MTYAWNWLGVANLTASLLLLVLAFLFLRAKRSEFTVTFTLFSMAGAGSKFAGGLWLYFATDAASRSLWHWVVVLLWLPLFPLLAHALSAFVWSRRFGALAWWVKAGIYVPALAFAPFVVVEQEAFLKYSYAFGLAFAALLLPFVAILVAKLRGARARVERVQTRYVLTYLVIILLATIASRAIPVLFPRQPFPHWELAIVYVLATSILLYGILKTQLFDIDVKIKWTLHRGTVAAIFVATFFVVSKVAENLLNRELGWAAGGIAAGILLFAISPLQRLAERVANAALPHVKPVAALPLSERESIYYDQARAAWSDGALDRSERQLLDHLRARLGLSADSAMRLESRASQSA